MAGAGLNKLRTWLAVAGVAIAASYTYSYIQHISRIMGVGYSYASVNATSCYKVGEGVLHGCEDIVVDPETGLAYLACGDLRARQTWIFPDKSFDAVAAVGPDRVFTLDEKNRYSELRVLERGQDGRLQPFSQDLRLHGFDIYWDPANRDDMTFMFVNHQREHNAVSIFEHTRGTDYLVHKETVKSDLLKSPNNILALSKRSFYATNDMKYTKGVMKEISNSVLRLPNAHVVYHDENGHFRIAADAIRVANGIGKHGEYVYVSSCSDPSVHIYKLGLNHTLEFQGRTFYEQGIPDNIFVDQATGQLYLTSFLKLMDTMKIFNDPSLADSVNASTQVLRLTQRANPQDGFDIESLLIDSGALMPTATIPVVQRRNNTSRIVVGCVMCNHVAVCDNALR